MEASSVNDGNTIGASRIHVPVYPTKFALLLRKSMHRIVVKSCCGQFEAVGEQVFFFILVHRPLASDNTVKESGEEDDCENITKLTNLDEVGHGDNFSGGTVIHKNAATVNKDVTSPICDDVCFPKSNENGTPAGVRVC